MKSVKYIPLMALLTLSPLPQVASACDLHGMPGFGFGMVGRSSNAPQWQPNHAADQVPTSKLQTNAIKLIGVGKASDVSVKYQIVEPYENATITASSNLKLELVGDKAVDVSDTNGNVTFSITAKQAGRYILNLEMIAKGDGDQQQKVTKQVYVNARADI